MDEQIKIYYGKAKYVENIENVANTIFIGNILGFKNCKNLVSNKIYTINEIHLERIFIRCFKMASNCFKNIKQLKKDYPDLYKIYNNGNKLLDKKL